MHRGMQVDMVLACTLDAMRSGNARCRLLVMSATLHEGLADRLSKHIAAALMLPQPAPITAAPPASSSVTIHWRPIVRVRVAGPMPNNRAYVLLKQWLPA